MEETTTFQGLRHLFVTIFLYCFSVFIVAPVITDVSMAALCPGKDESSLAIYLSGFQQAITGVGLLMVMPIVGSLSDKSMEEKVYLLFQCHSTFFLLTIAFVQSLMIRVATPISEMGFA